MIEVEAWIYRMLHPAYAFDVGFSALSGLFRRSDIMLLEQPEGRADQQTLMVSTAVASRESEASATKPWENVCYWSPERVSKLFVSRHIRCPHQGLLV